MLLLADHQGFLEALLFTVAVLWHNSEQVLGSGEFWRRNYPSLLSGKKADSDGGQSTSVPKHHPSDRIVKDGFSERTALRQCTLFPKLQIQKQPPATGCVSWDLAQLACVKVFPVPIRDLVLSP